jgi:hypothetical protein
VLERVEAEEEVVVVLALLPDIDAEEEEIVGAAWERECEWECEDEEDEECVGAMDSDSLMVRLGVGRTILSRSKEEKPFDRDGRGVRGSVNWIGGDLGMRTEPRSLTRIGAGVIEVDDKGSWLLSRPAIFFSLNRSLFLFRCWRLRWR